MKKILKNIPENIRSWEITAVRKTVLPFMTASLTFVVMMTGCVKDELFNTPHPEHGKITLTTDWNHRTEGLDVPSSYSVEIGDYTAQATDAVHEADYLFEPGDYRIIVHNPAADITVSGTKATVSPASGNWDGVGSFISGTPGVLFTHVQDVAIKKDTDHSFTAVMRQQVRRLTLVIEPTGDASDRIESIEGYLDGAAGTLDFAEDTHGTPSNVELHFTKITEGADAGKWSATVELLGTAGSGQRLTAQLRFADNNPKSLTFSSDLTDALSGFNDDKTVPLAIGGTLVETPTEAGFGAEIKDWETVEGDPTEAI